MKSLRSRLISILRWSERYTKTDMVYLASGGMWLGVAQLSASVAAFVLTVVLANVLSQETLGEYRFLMAALMILSAFALPGMRSAIIESTPKGFRGNLLTGFALMKKWAVLGSLLGFIVALYYFANANYSIGIGFLVAGLALPFLEASSLHIEFLKAIRKFNLVTWSTLITRGTLLITTLVAVFFFPDSAWILFASFVTASTVPSLIFHRNTVRKFISSEDSTDPSLGTYAKHLSIMAGLGLIATQVDKIFVWHFLGSQELALFFIAFAIPQETIRFLGIIPSLAFPKFAAAHPEKTRKELLPKILLYGSLILTGAVLYILCAPLLFKILFPEYISALPYSQVLMLAAVGSAFLPLSTFLTAHKHTKSLYVISILVPAVRIFSSFFLIMFFGLWGAVAAIIIESIFLALLLVFFFTRKTSKKS